MNVQNKFFDDAPYENDEKIEKCEKSFLMDIRNVFFGKNPVYLRDIII